MSLLKDLQGLNAAYAEMQRKEAYTVTAADKKGNTPAYQGYKAGKKNVKTGEPMYKAADHLKKEDRESKLWDEVAKMLTELHELRGVKYKVVLFNEDAQSDAVAQMSGDGGDPQDDAVKQVAGKKKKAKKDYDGDGKIESGKDEYFGSRDKAIKKAMGKKVKEEVSDETKKLIESGKFTQEEIDAIVEADRLGKIEAWVEFDEGYQRDPERGEREDTRSARQKRMDSPDKGINSPAFRKFMADKDKGSSAKKSAPKKSKPNPQGTLHLSPEERKKREAKRREDLYKRSADMRRDQKKRGVGVYAKGAKNPGADMDKKLGI